jgi:hypothetical protein
VPGFEKGGVDDGGGGRGIHSAAACDEQADREAGGGAEREADDHGENGVHGAQCASGFGHRRGAVPQPGDLLG